MELDKIKKATNQVDIILNNISINFNKLLLQDEQTEQYQDEINRNFDEMLNKVNQRRNDILFRLKKMKQAKLAEPKVDESESVKKKKNIAISIVYGFIRRLLTKFPTILKIYVYHIILFAFNSIKMKMNMVMIWNLKMM